MLYLAMNGAKQIMQAQAVNAQNLANANVTGFREDLASFQQMPVDGPGYSSRVYTAGQGMGVNFQAGEIVNTGRELDIAVAGDGWIAVQNPDGSEAYTRAGNMNMSADGLLTTADGRPVIGNGGGPITIPPSEKIEIGEDGTISVRPVGQGAEALVTVDRIKLVKPDIGNMTKGIDGLMYLRDGGTADPVADVSVVSGALEKSNVNTIDAMVNMIGLARQYEMQVKLMSTTKENDTASSRLISIK